MGADSPRKGSAAPVVEAWRAAIRDEISRSSLRAFADKTGIPRDSLISFTEGRKPHGKTAAMIEQWYNSHMARPATPGRWDAGVRHAIRTVRKALDQLEAELSDRPEGDAFEAAIERLSPAQRATLAEKLDIAVGLIGAGEIPGSQASPLREAAVPSAAVRARTRKDDEPHRDDSELRDRLDSMAGQLKTVAKTDRRAAEKLAEYSERAAKTGTKPPRA